MQRQRIGSPGTYLWSKTNVKYVLERKIGAGVFGSVWTIKNMPNYVLKMEVADSPTREIDFYQQTKGLSEKIPFFLDWGCNKRFKFIVIERYDIDMKRVRIPTPIKFSWVVLDLLKDLHSLGFSHQDIKLNNIFGKCNGRISLGDFGWAQRFPRRDQLKEPAHEENSTLNSIEAHLGLIRTESSDWQNWLFLLLKLMFGQPPWGNPSTQEFKIEWKTKFLADPSSWDEVGRVPWLVEIVKLVRQMKRDGSNVKRLVQEIESIVLQHVESSSILFETDEMSCRKMSLERKNMSAEQFKKNELLEIAQELDVRVPKSLTKAKIIQRMQSNGIRVSEIIETGLELGFAVSGGRSSWAPPSRTVSPILARSPVADVLRNITPEEWVAFEPKSIETVRKPRRFSPVVSLIPNEQRMIRTSPSRSSKRPKDWGSLVQPMENVRTVSWSRPQRLSPRARSPVLVPETNLKSLIKTGRSSVVGIDNQSLDLFRNRVEESWIEIAEKFDETVLSKQFSMFFELDPSVRDSGLLLLWGNRNKGFEITSNQIIVYPSQKTLAIPFDPRTNPIINVVLRPNKTFQVRLFDRITHWETWVSEIQIFGMDLKDLGDTVLMSIDSSIVLIVAPTWNASIDNLGSVGTFSSRVNNDPSLWENTGRYNSATFSALPTVIQNKIMKRLGVSNHSDAVDKINGQANLLIPINRATDETAFQEGAKLTEKLQKAVPAIPTVTVRETPTVTFHVPDQKKMSKLVQGLSQITVDVPFDVNKLAEAEKLFAKNLGMVI